MAGNHDRYGRYGIRYGILAAALFTLLLALAACAAPEAIPQAAAPAAATPAAFIPTPAAAMDASNLPPAATAARAQLAVKLNLDQALVNVLSVEPMDWPDSCLGVVQAGEMCASVITPGYRVTLDAQGKQYVLHTNDDGSYYRIADAPAAQTGAALITWMGVDEQGLCSTARISPTGVAYGGCDAADLVTVPLTFSGRNDDLDDLRTTYAPFNTKTAAGDVIFAGEGATAATPAVQRMIAERARNAFFEARGGVSATGLGLALQLYQQGGIAALCRNVSVYLIGLAYVADCAAQPAAMLPAVLLDDAQLQQLYAWNDGLAAFDTTHSEGTADVMTTTVSFFGAASAPATDADKQAMEAFALDLVAQAQALRSADACPAPTATQTLYRNDAYGFCFLYPTTVAPVATTLTNTVFVGGGDVMNHADPRFEVTVLPGGAAAADAAAALQADVLKSIPDAQVGLSTVPLDGAHAEQVDKVPGQDFSRVLFVSNGDTLLKFAFIPADPAMVGYDGMEALYTAVTDSFTFLK